MMMIIPMNYYFLYQVDKKILKGKNVNIFSKVDNKSFDNYYFQRVYLTF